MNSDQLALRHKVNLIYTVFKIRFIGVDHVKFVVEYCYNLYSLMCKILLQSILFSEKYFYNLYFLV